MTSLYRQEDNRVNKVACPFPQAWGPPRPKMAKSSRYINGGKIDGTLNVIFFRNGKILLRSYAIRTALTSPAGKMAQKERANFH